MKNKVRPPHFSSVVDAKILARTHIAEGKKRIIRHLDLGTGNASVLQMATRYVPSRLERSRYDLEAVGVEARRSLSFNPGTRRARREGTQQRY